jgi:anti-sigma factor RsiW
MKELPGNRMKNACKGMEPQLAEMLLSAEAAPAELRAHVEGCAHCRAELAALRATMTLLDTWDAPEPTPYFMTRLEARMREERAAEPAAWPARWLARWQDRLALGNGAHVQPLAAMALTVLLLVGGGAYLGTTDWDQEQAPPGQAAAVVHDLQTMDNNAQLLDQLEAMSNNSDNGD